MVSAADCRSVSWGSIPHRAAKQKRIIMNVDLDKDVIAKLMNNHIKHTSSKEFLSEQDFEAFGKAVFNDIIIDILEKKL